MNKTTDIPEPDTEPEPDIQTSSCYHGRQVPDSDPMVAGANTLCREWLRRLLQGLLSMYSIFCAMDTEFGMALTPGIIPETQHQCI